MARNPFFAALNFLGLSVGFASFYILWQYSATELKSDQYHRDADRIARIGLNWRWTDDGGATWGHVINGNTRASLFPRVAEEFPEVEKTVRILAQPLFDLDIVSHKDQVVVNVALPNNESKIFNEDKVVYADSNLFNFFTIPLIYGDANRALKEAGSVALSQSTAAKYFGSGDPIGALVALNDSITLKITAVFEDLPGHSHLDFDLVISNVGYEVKWQSCVRSNAFTYVKLRNTDFKGFEAKLNERVVEYYGDILRLPMASNAKIDLFVQPLREIPFSHNFEYDTFQPKFKPFLLLLAFIAASVLAMAWINYVNLTIIRIKGRLKEVATRKVAGANTKDMFLQFLTESLLTNCIALLLAATAIQVIETPVRTILDLQIAEFRSLDPGSGIILVCVFAGGVFITGLYPAWVSRIYKPGSIFSLSKKPREKSLMPSLLTIGQMALAIVFILFGFAVTSQLNHVLNQDTGINKEEVIIVEAPVVKPKLYSSMISTFKEQLTGLSNVRSVSLSNSLFSVGNDWDTYSNIRNPGADLSFGTDKNFVDSEFLPFYNIRLVAGRNFQKNDLEDVVLISRRAALRLGHNPEQAISANINYSDGISTWKTARVIGVFEDYRLTSFIKHNRTDSDIGRGIMLLNSGAASGRAEKLGLRIETDELRMTLRTIEHLYREQFPGNPFVWYFLDEQINRAYTNEKVARNQVMAFTLLSIGISCLGLLGIISNRIIERTKEIGVRKVLGANMQSIVLLLLGTSFRHIVLAAGIGIPISYYLINQYLEKFTSAINMRWWHYLIPLIILLMIMLGTVAKSVWRAARSNPVDALKHE